MNSLMEYKGYHAAIEYSAEDHAMIGQIIGINDVLAFDAENVDELEAMFHETIDDYLEMCARTGKDPDKEYKGSFNIRIGSELHKKADFQAKAQHMSLNDYVKRAIQSEVECTRQIKEIIYVMPTKVFASYSGYQGQDSTNNYKLEGGETKWETMESTLKVSGL